MKYTRDTQITSLTIHVPSSVQPIDGIPVQLAHIETVKDAQGNQVGHQQHFQRQIIKSDLTPEIISQLNASLAYLGCQIAPITEAK